MIKFDKVFLSYKSKQVFSDLSFDIRQGDKAVILGRSGLGKSSLFHLILGFALAEKGEVCFDGVPVTEKNVWDVRRKIAFVDQDVSIGDNKVIDRLQYFFGLKANAVSGFPEKRMIELVEYFELDIDVLHKNIVELSGGERQRLAIIVSVLLGRSVYLLDEITSALDKHLKEKVVDYFTSRDDWTVVVVSHDPAWLKKPEVKTFDLEAGKWKQ
jgi:putative ABC transport system ATP-binding protein